MHTYAIDTETYYDSSCTIKAGLDAYLNHPKFDCYMLTVVGDDGTKYAGRPEDFDWDKIAGHIWLSHNRSFDAGVIHHMMDKGIIPKVEPHEWHCTSDMVAFFGYPRSLKGSSGEVLDEDVSKDTRDKMKGEKWEEMSEEFKAEVLQYATKDSELCLALWQKLGHLWPQSERQVSALTTKMCHRGLFVDKAKLDKSIDHLSSVLHEIEDLIPWSGDQPNLSPKALGQLCRNKGVNPPPSTDKKNPEYHQWKQANPEVAVITEAMGDYRSVNKLSKQLATIKSRIRESDGRMGYGLKYCGAHTGRDSGDSGFNVQNMPRGEMFGVDLRSLITAGPGNVLIVSDLSQIEPRCLAYLAGDSKMLEIAKTSDDWYEVQARAWGLWTQEGSMKEHDPDLRHMVKQLNLGLGYGMSAAKFMLLTGLPAQRCEYLTELYRKTNPKVTALWKKMSNGMQRSATKGETFEVQLPSGRSIMYHRCSSAQSLSAVITKGGSRLRLKFWHGTLVENLVQACARDVFMSRVLELEKHGFPVILRVHDEVVCEIPESEAAAAQAKILEIMSTPPDWMPGLPLAASCEIMKEYSK